MIDMKNIERKTIPYYCQYFDCYKAGSFVSLYTDISNLRFFHEKEEIKYSNSKDFELDSAALHYYVGFDFYAGNESNQIYNLVKETKTALIVSDSFKINQLGGIWVRVLIEGKFFVISTLMIERILT